MVRFGVVEVVAIVVILMIAVLGICFGVYAAVSTPTAVHTQYPTQGTPTKAVDTLRAVAVLTTSYVDTTDSAAMRGYRECRIFFDITRGSLTSFEYRILTSHDGVNWFYEANETVTPATITDAIHAYTIALSGNIKYYKDIPTWGLYLKLEVKGTGTVTGSLCAVYIMGVR